MITALLAWGLAPAQAQEPELSTGPLPVMEITVWGRLAIDQAEDDVVREMESLGYRAVRKGDKIVFRPPRAWMGAAVWQDGSLTFRQPIAGFQPAPTYTYEQDLKKQGGAIDPGGRHVVNSQGGLSFWLFPSRTKVGGQRGRVRAALADELAWYDAVVARTAVEEAVFALPDQLDAVWQRGEPLVGTTTLDSYADRRRHVLEYWATRADTPEGQRIAGAVSNWLRAIVQTSDHPITDAERTTYEARRTDVLTLP